MTYITYNPVGFSYKVFRWCVEKYGIPAQLPLGRWSCHYSFDNIVLTLNEADAIMFVLQWGNPDGKQL